MLQLAITCLVIALIAFLLGFGGIAGSFVGVAKILFVVFLVLALLSFVAGGMRRRRLGVTRSRELAAEIGAPGAGNEPAPGLLIQRK